MECLKITEIEKENAQLRRKLESYASQNDELQQNRLWIRELDERIVQLKDQIENSAVKIHVNVQKTQIESAEHSQSRIMKEYPSYIRIPVSVVRVADLPLNTVNEISPQRMNSIVSQIEANLRKKLIISVNS